MRPQVLLDHFIHELFGYTITYGNLKVNNNSEKAAVFLAQAESLCYQGSGKQADYSG